MPELLWSPACEALVDLALEEDLGRGDATTDATIPHDKQATGVIKAKEPLVLAGLAVASRVFEKVSSTVRFEALLADGSDVERGTHVVKLAGPAWALLAGERTALNFLQRLSGVATQSRRYAAAAAGTSTRVVDTRKTTPGWRALEKWAVAVGGASNHRADLGSGILIKDNHVAVAGGVAAAVMRAQQRASHALRIEVEVTTLPQLEEALGAGAEIVLLDNMGDDEVARAVNRVRAHGTRVLIEVSGGITLERIPRLAALGVDLISCGALTHSSRAVDLSLDLDIP